ncbi:ABC transporter substrate-binding protein [Sphaerisporangium album]|uniref:ABC transporter substrate-binding protein n=1 Tax=Sphaerisporangium album TaxID=509200 RepID=UPI0011C0422A|nr:ABC transporter substrate-binding protein [Sphaerisporangium album]
MRTPASPVPDETGEEGEPPLPRNVQYLFMRIDDVAVERPATRRLPVVLLRREAGTGPQAAEEPAEGEGTDGAASRMITVYRDRLRRRSAGMVGLVPHAYVEDAALTRGGARDDDEGGAEPHIRVVSTIAAQLERSMPPGSGTLRLSRYQTLHAILGTRVGGGSGARRRLRDRLYEDLTERRPWLGRLASLAEAGGRNALTGVLLKLFEMLVVGVPRWVYGVWLGRSRSWRWVGARLRIPGRDFLKVAMELAADGDVRHDDVLTQRILLMALMRDLDEAARPSRLWVHRVRRPWPFVVLLATVGDEDSPSRRFLDNYVSAGETGSSASSSPPPSPPPLLVLGALTGKVPSYAVALTPDPESKRPDDLAVQVRDLYAGRSTGLPAGGVYVVPLSKEDDDGAAEQWLRTTFEVPARENRHGDYVRPILSMLVPLALVAGALFAVHPWRPSACQEVTTGEIVGVTDGQECSLAAGEKGQELRDLEQKVSEQNRAVEKEGKPYRSVVFFAPLSVSTDSGETAPNGLQGLRGAIIAQAQLNRQEVKRPMRIRLLIANAGQYFAYGAQNSDGPDVAQEIIKRKDHDRIAAVIGITQSRPESLRAIGELDAAQIPVVGISVTGSEMLDKAPDRYFQVSPQNRRIAKVIAEFLAHHAPASTTRPAVVVYDPEDTYFSKDLMTKFTEAYTAYGATVEEVAYSEKDNGPSTDGVARRICARARNSGAFVVYAGRSAVMPDLLGTMQSIGECHMNDTKIDVLAESPPAKFLEDPALAENAYSFMNLYYVGFNAGGAGAGNDGYDHFSSQFKDRFPAGQANSDAAGGYDALRVVSQAVNGTYPKYPDGSFGPNEVYGQLYDPGVVDYLGASGVLTLNKNDRFPARKAVYILRPTGGKVDTLMACGRLPDQSDPSTWQGGSCPGD